MYIDSHAHLDGPKFDQDRNEVLARARDAGLERILSIGSGAGPGTLDCAIKIAEQHDWIYATIGIHPHEAKLATEADYVELQQLAPHPKVMAWGEIGLDYFYDHSPREVQQEVFRRQMELARAARLPIIIHCRPSNNSENAWDDTIKMLRDHWAPSGLPGTLHCFTGEWKHAQAALDIGFYTSFAGNVSFPKAENIRDAARRVPLDRMLIETDCPFLAPVPHRGKRNEPAFVVNTAELIGGLRGLSKEEIGERTRENFYRLFPLTVF
ncbi:MAG TPA: TatD family hydrolase [Verrucomicrobiae bacterium]|jgi:TatD DNase family protein|nr:TatD family hydrolase [Verrucomicrobiae bacterium]